MGPEYGYRYDYDIVSGKHHVVDRDGEQFDRFDTQHEAETVVHEGRTGESSDSNSDSNSSSD